MAPGVQFNLKRKLSAKEIVGDVKKLFREAIAKNPQAKKIDLFKVGGFINRFDHVETNYGDSTRFIGDFIAVNAQTGEGLRSNRLFLPAIISDQMEAELTAKKLNDSSATMEFGFSIAVIPDDKSATGYVYIAEPIVKVAETDAMKSLADKLGVKLALPAPETAPEKSAPAKSDEKSHKGDGKSSGKK